MSGELSVAEDERFATAKVADGVLLDSRLALYHETQRWLVLSDLHLGSNPTKTSRPEMLATWGRPDVETRILALLRHYHPQKLIIAGDVMNFDGDPEEAKQLVQRLAKLLEVVTLQGNHDHPSLRISAKFRDFHLEDGFFFHHGHKPGSMIEKAKSMGLTSIHITGHSHPLTVLGTNKLPVFAMLPMTGADPGTERWILPAFAPWASGAWPLTASADTRLFAIEPGSILPLECP